MSSHLVSKFSLSAEITTIEGLQPLLASFVDAQDIKRSSQTTYYQRLLQFFRYLGVVGKLKKLNSLIKQDILGYKRYLESQDKKPSTIAAYLGVVRCFFRWLEIEKIYPDITRGIKSPKSAKGFKKDALSGEQVRSVLDRLNTANLQGLRDYAIINLMARTGLRTCEIVKASIKDIREVQGKVTMCVYGKGRDCKDEFVVLTQEALEPLQTYLAARQDKVKPTSPLFGSLCNKNYGERLTTKSIRRLCKKAFIEAGLDLPTISAHSLRHTAITLAVSGGATLHQAQAMARHQDPKTTQIYFHNVDRLTQAAEDRVKF